MERHKETRSDGWLLIGLQDLYREKRHCDIEIQIQKESFPCHKVVLSAASGYFDVMFASAMREANSSAVEIKDISAKTFDEILQFVYFDENVITTENVEELLHGACLLQISLLKDKCEVFLFEQLSAENSVGFWLIARSLSCDSLQTAAWAFIMESFDDVTKNEEFLRLEKDDFIEIIKNDNLNTKSEDIVCRAGLRWIKADESNRKHFLMEIFSEIRLCLVGLEFLLKEIYTNTLVHSDRNCMKLLSKAVKYHALPDRRHASKPIGVRPRNNSNRASLFIVIGRRQSVCGPEITEVVGYSAKDSKWYTLCSMPYDMGDAFATCPYGNDVFVSGGTTKTDAFLRFSAKHNKWTEKPPMIRGRYRHCLVAVADSIYAVGGYNFGTVGSVEEFDISSNIWQPAGELRHAVDAAASAVLGERIFIFGGWQGFSDETSAIQCFDTESNECYVVCHLPSPQKDMRAISYDDNIFIVSTKGEIFSFGYDHTLKKVENISEFTKKTFGVYKEGNQLLLLGGEPSDEEYEEDVIKSSDDVILVGEQSRGRLDFPTTLPIPMHVLGCFQTVIKLKYPLVEFSEQLSFTF